MKKPLFLFAALTLFSVFVFGQTQEEINKWVDLTRSDIRADKVQIITQAMQLSPEEAAAFWPVYSKYQEELNKIGDQVVALIKEYAEHYDSIDDVKARQLTEKAIDLEAQRIELMKKYLPEFGKTLPAKRVARLVQVENQLNRILYLKLASGIPLVP